MRKFPRLLLSGLALAGFILSSAAAATAQDRVLFGISRNGGVVFQTLIHRGRSNIHSKMIADGPGSRTESHAQFDDGAESSATAPQRLPDQAPPVQTVLQPAVEESAPSASAPVNAAKPATANAPAPATDGGGHLICIQQSDGSWKAYGLTPDPSKAQHAAQVLRLQKFEARVFQYLPLPTEAAELVPIDNAVGLAVRISGEVYAVAKNGRLVELLLPADTDSE